ncbi:MAG TPA: hypothetical protein VLG50_07160 [Candidatus Saccharimonadales bacterium]|nr:hypothetical protein [Candidatus Saccharimonadales bacterium]
MACELRCTPETFKAAMIALTKLPDPPSVEPNMVTITGCLLNPIAPELFQVYRKNNKYIYQHLLGGTHQVYKKEEVDPLVFEFPFPFEGKKITLLHGDTPVHINTVLRLKL